MAGIDRTMDLPPGSLAFTYCQTAIVYRLGDRPSLDLGRSDGGSESVDDDRLSLKASRAIVNRSDTYRVVTVTILRERLRAQ